MGNTQKVQYQGRRTKSIFQNEYLTILSETACCWSSPTLPRVLKNHNCVIQLLKGNFQIMKFGFFKESTLAVCFHA